MPLALTLQNAVSLPLPIAVSEFLCECRLRQLTPSTLQWYQYALEPFVRFAVARGEAVVTVRLGRTVAPQVAMIWYRPSLKAIQVSSNGGSPG